MFLMKIFTLLITLVRVFWGAILFFAGVAKITSFDAFVGDVARYGVLPMALTTPASYLLVSAEITVGATLMVGYFSRGAFMLAAWLFLLFAMAIASVLWRKLPLDECGCGNLLFDRLGISTHPNWKAVCLDFLLFLGGLLLARLPQQGYGVEWFTRSLSNGAAESWKARPGD